MDTFLMMIEKGMNNKEKYDKALLKYIEDIHNNLLIPLMSKYDLCEELIAFDSIFTYPFDKVKYNEVFKILIEKIKKNS